MVRYVTVGVDDSGESLAAAHWAAREALRRGAVLRLVHAVNWQSGASTAPMDTTRGRWAQQALEHAAGSVRAAHPGLQVEELLLPDAPLTALPAAAEVSEVLVLGSRGLGRLAGFVVGSVSQRVVARAARPVVLVRAGETLADEHLPALDGVSPDEIPETPYRDVVLGLDPRHAHAELVEFAFEAARLRGASLRVVHALGDAPKHAADGRSGPVLGPELLAEREGLLGAALRPWTEKFPEVPVSASVTPGQAATELVRAAARASLVVVGRRRRDTRLGTHIGPVVHAVLHHVGSPVAVVPHS
ncbi:universal stress family protein [Streptomyces hygroscopicus]|uniref:universal stress protein n=1 Tax=Streptomyces hygroscopicus TaxID=1912 RepID=UPI002240D664|nr:universal stress protein [Streptomyces hygroscopicus]MCW7945075.1 universal stress family protein [Streptomyces hygroscopicus]